MCRADVDAFATWGTHADPLFRQYNVRALSPPEAEGLWRMLAGQPDLRRPYVALADGHVVGSLIVRITSEATGDVGITLDPRRIGQGLGRRILAALSVVLTSEGFRRLYLDVAGYNARAIAAYRASGFVVVDERWDEPEAGVDIAALLRGPSVATLAPHVTLGTDSRYRLRVIRMERRLDTPLKVES
jgi:RimJ/RimL family protein N-acetyltransferase